MSNLDWSWCDQLVDRLGNKFQFLVSQSSFPLKLNNIKQKEILSEQMNVE